MITELIVKLTRCRFKRPLVILDNLPGHGAEMRPEALRSLANALLKAADDAESWDGPLSVEKRSYPIQLQNENC